MGKLSSDVKNDTNVWAMGSPTLELWVNSWNTNYPECIIYTAKQTGMSDTIGWGFYIGANADPTSYYIRLRDETGYNNTLYYPYKRSYYAECFAYWLASPSAQPRNGYDVIRVREDGDVGYSYSYETYMGVRPVVCLPSNILE